MIGKHIQEYNPETASAIIDEMHRQRTDAYSKFLEATAALSKFNFATNAGGSIAVLAYIGSGNAVSGMSVPLAIFILGVLLSGMEMLAVKQLYWGMSEAFSKLMREFQAGRGTSNVDELPRPTSLAGRYQRWFSAISQLAFLAGSLSGVLAYACAP